MDLAKVLTDRWSCRAYLPEAVDDDVLDAVLVLAQRTASWCNTQPWAVHLLGGDDLRRFGRDLRAWVEDGRSAGEPDLPLPSYGGVHLDRRRASGLALYAALGIGREDRAARAEQMLRNYEFFGAPHLAVVTTDRELGVYGVADCGGYVANLLNAAAAAGLGAIAQGALGAYADAVRHLLGLPEDRLVVCGVALGHPDLDHPANQFRTERASLPEIVRRVSYP